MVSEYTVTSDATVDYNCVAWAAESADAWWWPNDQYYWPEGIARRETLEAFQQLFESRGYQACDSAVLESGFEKVAIYTNAAGVPTHASRQLPDGRWTSKMGSEEDITHESLSAVTGRQYGRPTLFLKRSLLSRQTIQPTDG